MQATISIPAGIGVAIVAPSGYTADETALARGIARLERLGCVVHNYYDPERKFQRFAATDRERAAQLHAAADNPDVQIVLAMRGGYGMSRILDMLDLTALAASGKLFIGHSDFTALQLAMLAASDACTFAGPMVCDDFTRVSFSEFTHASFWNCVTANSAYRISAASTPGNPDIDVAGVLWGGNLSMVVALIGTVYFPRINGGILFLEDVNEHPYRVERMLLQLEQAGVLARQSAIVLGDFSNYKLNEYDNGYDFETMLAYLRSRLSVPIVTGLPFGHIRDKLTLPVGCRAILRCDSRTLELILKDYPTLHAVG
ncbi:MAG: muramoyltetrapeptide carboxypeptidase [Burkholderiales bacterium]|nr:muramoyltetrapeptide carboxypeptidase [Burkholderiales bacterium]